MPLQLSVRRKLLLLLVGTLVVAFALMAVALGWLIDRHHTATAGRSAHTLLNDLGVRLTAQHRLVAEGAQVLAGREDIVAGLALLTDYATPEHYQPYIFDTEKMRLADELRKYIETTAINELGIYDGSGQLAVFARRTLPDHGEKVLGISSWKNGERHWLSAAGGEPEGAPIDLPDDMPEQAGDFGMPVAPLIQMRRHKRHLALEAIVPVQRMLDGKLQRVGWVRLSQAVLPEDLDEQAHVRNMKIYMLFSGDFASDNPFGLRPEQFLGAPAITAATHDAASPHEVPNHPAYYIDLSALALSGNEQAWVVAAVDRAGMKEEQRRTLGVVLAVLAGSLLLVVPFSGWVGRRWISTPFDKLRDGVHAYTLGQLETTIDLHTGDEFEAIAEDFNLLAVALRVREIAIKEAEERWQFALDGAGHGVWDWNAITRETFYSPRWKAMLGYAEDEIGNRLEDWSERVHPEDMPAVQRAIDQHFSGATETYRSVHRLRGKDGAYRWILDQGCVVRRDPDGKPLRMIGTHTDITAQVEAERSIHEAATVFEATTESIMITDARGVIKRVNPAFTVICGYSAAEAIGRRPDILNSGHHDEEFFAEMWSNLLAGKRWEGEVWNRRKSGEVFPVWQVISVVKDDAGQPSEFVSLSIDITQRKRSEAEITYRANYDALTGLPNRNLLTERLGQGLKQARREGSRVAVMFVDLDFFKQVNDTLGHLTGDRLLQSVAARMRLCVRETDTIARQGGDEFVVLLVGIDDLAAASSVAEKIIVQMSTPFTIDEHEIHIGASIGITFFPDDGADVETLFRNADLAMYRAKDAGRNNAQFFEMALTTSALERRMLEADLRGALARGEFMLHFQPVIDLASGRIAGAETLLRWRHPRDIQIGPDRFVPLAEETGLIRDIGAWVFAESCRQLAAWQVAGHHLTLAINVSVRQLPDALSVAHMLTVLAQHDLAPRQIVLEITEGVLLADSPAIQEWFIAAAAAGFKLAIDDFGTGYSSLAYLKRFPVHHVKIDKGFVRDMETDPADRALIEAILAMAHSLGLSVVAEGVETVGQATLLQTRACEQAQGYLYSRPLPADEFVGLLTAPPRLPSL